MKHALTDQSKDLQEKAFFGGGLHLLNTTIIPPGASGTWVVEDVETEWAKHVVAHAGHWSMFPNSHIGHQATATIAGELLAVGVEVSRTPWDGRGLGLALQLNGRPEEGKILSREEMEALGYSWRVLYRIDPADGLPVDHYRPGSSREATSARERLRKDLPGGHLVFVRRGDTRSGAHNYLRALLVTTPDAPIDITSEVLAVLVDPLLSGPVEDGGGYSGSGQKGCIMVFGEEGPALRNLSGQIGYAIGLPGFYPSYSVA